MSTIFDVLGRHPIHPFPARMAPAIALDALEESTQCLRVLDPMAGSGTVLAVAQASGHTALGFDTDPLAVLMARVWTTPFCPETVVAKSKEVLRRARKLCQDLPLREAYPEDANAETRKFIRYWFDGRARRQLTSLATAIDRLRHDQIRDALWCAFSRLIITKQAGASRAMDLSHSRPHRTFEKAPILPFEKFIATAKVVANNCVSTIENERTPLSIVRRGDARSLPIESDSVDLVITSPPYLNAIDYIRCNKFSLVWMGHQISSLRATRADNIGTEIALPSDLNTDEVRDAVQRIGDISILGRRYEGILNRYIHDMSKALNEIWRVLRPNGRAILVIGNSTIRGTFIRNSDALSFLAERSGLCLENRSTRELPPNRRYLPPPSTKNAGSKLQVRMRSEVVLTFRAMN